MQFYAILPCSRLITKISNVTRKNYRHLVLLSLPLSVPAIADDALTQMCGASLSIPERPIVEDVLEPGDTHIQADDANLVEGGVSTLTGTAEVSRDSQQVRADRIDYNEPADNADLTGNVNYWDNGVFLESDSAHVEFGDGTGQFNQAEYKILENRGRGKADVLDIDAGERTTLHEGDYTTCNPDNEFWKISADKINLDHTTDRGTARNVVLRMKNIPVFYTPYMSFPLSKTRKSGFLTPGYGNSSRNGVEVSTPYYWNIAPNMDATLTPRLMSDSGVMLGGEFRYLYSTGRGQVDLEYLPSDNDFNNEDRNLFGFKHEQRFLENRGRLDLEYNRVSDQFYFEDFSSQLELASTRFLERKADLRYSGANGWWSTQVRVQDYQLVDRSTAITARPYKRLPQVTFNFNKPRENHALNYGLTADSVYFERGDNAAANVDGLRVDFKPYISYPMHSLSGYVEPKLALRYTYYDLDDTTLFTNQNPDRLLPIFTLDSGLYFDRSTQLFGKNLNQTLEPRLYYLYVPEDEQSDLPVFDTGQYTFNFNSLFYDNRFSGGDRQGDANQVTLAVTSRFLDETSGKDLGHISFGTILHLDNRKVVLPAGTAEDGTTSSLIAEVSTRVIDDWLARANIEWDPNDSKTRELSTLLRYNPNNGTVVNFAYRMRDDGFSTSIEQSDISFRVPFNKSWSAVGRWNYALPESRSLEMFGGIEYNSCCFGVRAVARRFLTNINGEYESGIFLQMELKGLAGVGQKAANFLEQQIPGYTSDF